MSKQERDALYALATAAGPDSGATGEEIRADAKKQQRAEKRQDQWARIIAWDNGEELRLRRIWFEAARAKACRIIARRKKAKAQDLREEDCVVLPRRGDGALLLPVVYEFFRQSERCLQWAILLESIGGSEAFANKRDSHVMERVSAGDMEDQWRAQIGRGWVDAMRALVGFLAKDVPFTRIPTERRASVARLAESSSRDNIAISMNFTVVDGGGVKFEPFNRMIGRETVRLAHFREATQKGTIKVLNGKNGKRMPPEQYAFPHAIKATCDEDASTGDIGRRCIDEHGAEIIALRVNWNGTRNGELGKALAALAKQMRPEMWPEQKERRGNRTKDARAALRAVLLAVNSDGASLGAKDQEIARKWYHGITGDTVSPWWDRQLKSK